MTNDSRLHEGVSAKHQTGCIEHEHSPDAIRGRLESGPKHNYLRDWIYGGIDGAVTTLAVVTGVAGAQLSTWIILTLGFAEGEREEVRQIFERKGFEGEELGRIVELITADRERRVQTMLMDEYGLPHAVRSPWIACGWVLSTTAILHHNQQSGAIVRSAIHHSIPGLHICRRLEFTSRF